MREERQGGGRFKDGVREEDNVESQVEGDKEQCMGQCEEGRRVEKQYNELNQRHAYSTQCQAMSVMSHEMRCVENVKYM